MKTYLSLFLLLSSFVFADDQCCIPLEKPCCVPPEKPFPKIVNCRDYNVLTVGEFLYWRFSSPNLVFGRSGVGVKGAAESAVTRGTSYLPDFDYKPGFRVGLGLKFGPSKAFDLIGYYTWYYTNPSKSLSGDQISSSFIPNNFFNSGTVATNTYSFAHFGMNLHLSYAEIQSGYNFSINRYLALRPYIALTAIFVDSDLDTRYHFISAATAPVNPSTFEVGTTHGDCDSWSIGPKTGLDFVVHVNRNWGIYSNVNITQQISHIKMKVVETEDVPSLGTSFVIQKGHLTENRNIALFGLEIGPTFDYWFCDYTYHVYVRATYGASNLNNGANLSFLNNNNLDLVEQAEIRGLNVRALFEF